MPSVGVLKVPTVARENEGAAVFLSRNKQVSNLGSVLGGT